MVPFDSSSECNELEPKWLRKNTLLLSYSLSYDFSFSFSLTVPYCLSFSLFCSFALSRQKPPPIGKPNRPSRSRRAAARSKARPTALGSRIDRVAVDELLLTQRRQVAGGDEPGTLASRVDRLTVDLLK